MATLIRNITGSPVTLPSPYRGLLPPGAAVAVSQAEQTVVDNLGADNIRGVLEVRGNIPDAQGTSGFQDASPASADPFLQVKAAVRAATTANLASLAGLLTVDGVALVAGDRVLVKDQAAPANNGIYVVASGAWARATDADTSAKVVANLYAWVNEGTVNADSGWVLTTNNAITLGTTGLTFAQFTGAGGITAGAGLTKTGNTLDVVANADASITVNANDIQVGVLATDGQHGTRGGGTQHAAATTSVNGFLSATDKTRIDGALSSVARLFQVSAPAAASTTAVHAGYAGNNASNTFPGPFTNPVVPRNLTVTFGATWDGGTVNVVGTDQYDVAINENFVPGAGTTVTGTKVFKTATSATKSLVGVDAATASIGTGTKLGVVANLTSAFGILTVDGAAEAVTVDATNDAFTPTTAPNGARVYVLAANL